MTHYTMRSTVIVPDSVAVLEGGQTIHAGDTVRLPERYGDHLVSWRLAERADAPKPVERDLSAMTRADLDALAETMGVDVSRARVKADVIAALREAGA